MTTWYIITGISLLLSALFSGMEIAFVTADRVRTKLDVARGGIISKLLEKFYSDSEFFISSILVGNNIMLVIYGMGIAKILEPAIVSWGVTSSAMVLLIQTLISTIIILFAGEFIPKTTFRINPNSSLKIFALPIFLFYLLFYPVSWLSTILSRLIMKAMGIKAVDQEAEGVSVDALGEFVGENIDRSEELHHQVDKEVKIFRNALDFSSTHLRDCMIPRNEIVAVDRDEVSRDDLVRLFTLSGRSKIIVYSGDIDNILGYIHVYELFNEKSDWKQHIKPVLFAPENLLANKMMRRLLQQKRSLAVVVDEFGGTAGLISLEDLVEEIFGDIQDEHDRQRLTMRQVSPGVYDFSGRCEVAAINEQFHLDIPESDDYQTIAGFILCSTGAIPPQGEDIVLNGLTFNIVHKRANRIEMIRVTMPTEQPNPED